MPKLRTQIAKQKLLGKVRRQRLKYITVLPSLVTILNGVCGFAALVLVTHNEFAQAGYVLLLAMIADMLDGHLARISKSTSSFGGQLDSLCDIISFGAAPAFLMFKVVELKFNTLHLEPIERFIWLAAAAYTSCTAIRLARFNVENEEDESAHMSFIGLPAPAAAGVIASLIIFQQESLGTIFPAGSKSYNITESSIIYALPILVLFLSILMVSRIRYHHIINHYIKGRKPFEYLTWLILALGVVLWNLQIALVLIFWGFTLSGLVKWVYYKITRKQYLISFSSEHNTAMAADGANTPTQNDSV
jgi:CDP-diacylglycerol--serine O-phosphatidyltransferase